MNTDLGPRGLTILGFPCNQFGAQEPKPEATILEEVTSKYGCNFYLMAKVDVLGENQHEVYKFLTANAQGLEGDITWNFAKFLVNADGSSVQYYNPKFEPKDIIPDIEKLLQ